MAEKTYRDMSREEVIALRDEHYARLKWLHFEADFLIYAIGLLDKHLAGHSEMATIFGGKCSCDICKLDWN